LLFVYFSLVFINNEQADLLNVMQENEIIEVAVDQLNKQTGLGAALTFPKPQAKKTIDGHLKLPMTNIKFNIECKKWVNKANLQRYLTEITLNDLEANTIFVTEYLNPNLAEQLKTQDIQFLDTVGNAFINQPPVYIDIQGKKPSKHHKDVILAKQLGKAFQPKGMNVVFMLLIYPALLNTPMRNIADKAEVALGTVKQVMDDLIYQGLVIEKGNKRKVVENPKALLGKWLDAYPANMEAKLNQALFTTDNPEQLKALNIGVFGGLWGGEVAAERYDHYLKAKDFLIYLAPEQKQAFLKAARLRKPAHHEQPDYKVMVVEPPLAINKITGDKTDLAHPLLVYANLITNGDARNMDAARRLYSEYLN
jgi:hypothetical protein